MRLEANVNTPSKNSEGCLALNVYRGTWPEQKAWKKEITGFILSEGHSELLYSSTVITPVSFLCLCGPYPPENQWTEGNLICIAH